MKLQSLNFGGLQQAYKQQAYKQHANRLSSSRATMAQNHHIDGVQVVFGDMFV